MSVRFVDLPLRRSIRQLRPVLAAVTASFALATIGIAPAAAQNVGPFQGCVDSITPPPFQENCASQGIASLDIDLTNSSGAQLIEHGNATDQGPSVSVSAEGDAPLGELGFASTFKARAEYSFIVVPNPGAPNARVPITIDGNIEADASLTNGIFSSAAAQISSDFGDETVTANCTPSGDSVICNIDPPLAFDFAGLAVPGADYTVGLFAGVAGQGIFNADANADPVISVSNDFIPGTNTRWSDLFSLELSPGVVQGNGAPKSVPEPATPTLLVACLFGAALFARRRREFLGARKTKPS
jgi:hypothetical protein